MADREPEIQLGQFTGRVGHYVDNDVFHTVDDVLVAALDALDRDRALWTATVRGQVQEALDDPRPDAPIDDAFARVRDTIKTNYRA